MSGTAPALSRPLTSNRLRFSPGTWWTLFLFSLLLYALTANRGMQWVDSGAHILRVMEQRVDHHLGLALAHPLHHWIARLLAAVGPFEIPYAVTLVSALAGAFTIANVYGAVVTLTDRHLAGVFAAASLAMANTFWQMSTVAEIYTLCTALLAAELWCMAGLIRTGRTPWLYGMVLFNGLGIANHMLASLTTPVVVVVVMSRLMQRRKFASTALIAAALWVLGTLPYTLMILSEWWSTGNLAGTVRSALFGDYAGEVLNASFGMRQMLITLAFPVYNFPNLLLPAAAYGLFRWRVAGVARGTVRALMAGLIIHVLFAMRYNVHDQHTFFLPMYTYFAIFGGIGAAVVLNWPRLQARRQAGAVAAVFLILTPVVYAVTPALARRMQVLERANVMRSKPYRDDYRFVFWPWSVADTSAERMSAEAVSLAGSNGWILTEDRMAQYALRSQKRLMEREGITIDIYPRLPSESFILELQEKLRSALEADVPVVLVPLDADAPRVPLTQGHWKREGDLYVLSVEPPTGIPSP